VRAALARRRPRQDPAPPVGATRDRARCVRPRQGLAGRALRRVTLDAESLLADAAHAAALLADGQTDPAREILSDIDHRYCGHAFEDEPYEDWAQALREETRGAWLRSLRHLAILSLREGRMTDACALLVRLLGADPYDERMHRTLVRALVRTGRHGEARRAFDQWASAMCVVDAPRPDPRVLIVTQP
jgi:pentatricopeptide repeat protein